MLLLIKKVSATLLVVTMMAVTILAVLVIHNGFPLKYMDIDDSGWVSPSEMYQTLDLGVRQRETNGQLCVEIFSLKDGLPIKLICGTG